MGERYLGEGGRDKKGREGERGGERGREGERGGEREREGEILKDWERERKRGRER